MSSFKERLSDPRPILYDGGFGSQLFARGIELINSTIANDTHPEAVKDIHRAYIEAGAETVGTNTFVASALHLEMADRTGDAADDIARKAAENARVAVEKSGARVYVGGSMGPSPGAIEADSGDTVFGIANEKVRDAHARLSTALAEGGVDFFMIETQFSANEAAIAVDEARKHGLPIAVSMTYKVHEGSQNGRGRLQDRLGAFPPDIGRLACLGGSFGWRGSASVRGHRRAELRCRNSGRRAHGNALRH